MYVWLLRSTRLIVNCCESPHCLCTIMHRSSPPSAATTTQLLPYGKLQVKMESLWWNQLSQTFSVAWTTLNQTKTRIAGTGSGCWCLLTVTAKHEASDRLVNLTPQNRTNENTMTRGASWVACIIIYFRCSLVPGIGMMYIEKYSSFRLEERRLQSTPEFHISRKGRLITMIILLTAN